jgi:hypothetical protein
MVSSPFQGGPMGQGNMGYPGYGMGDPNMMGGYGGQVPGGMMM